MDSLRPCPFCGGEARMSGERFENTILSWVYCVVCGAAGGYRHIEADAIAAWNKRAERTCELHDCEGSFSAVNKPAWRCDCGAFMTQYTDATTYHKPRFCPNCGAKVVE